MIHYKTIDMTETQPRTLVDEVRALLPAIAAKHLFQRCELAQTSEDVSKTMSAMYRSGEVLRTETAPYGYWRNDAYSAKRPRKPAHAPHVHPYRLAVETSAQPEVAQNTGSAPSAFTSSRAEGRAIPVASGAAACAAAPEKTGVPTWSPPLDGEDLRCALWNDGCLMIEAGGQRMHMNRKRTMLLFAYLEHVADVLGT